ncbi:uncharacterized protein LOC124268078 [Haliotis rubra]|uniref:uncharacterized protein LOC124268078 n=1 Tax=Haliotis rubra TaxID=36100 RepID=UPI001EE5F98D|nr:uncharacterized protein LOC124268078 [Haliotis rubra]
MPLLINTRAEKVRRLCQEGSKKDVPEQIELFTKALAEAKQLSSNREQNVCICRLNLATAYVHSADSIRKGIDMLTAMTTEAETHHPAILGDIYYYKAVGMMRVKGNGDFTHRESDAILDALYRAKHYDDSSDSDTPLKKHILKSLLRFERRDSERCELLKQKILAFRQDKESADEDTVLQMVCELMNLLLKRDPSEAKKDGPLYMAVIPEDSCDKISTTTWCDLGLISTQIQEYGKAVRYFERSHHKLQKSDLCKDLPQQCLQMRHNIAAVNLLQKDFTTAISTYAGEDGEKSLDDLREEIQDKDLLSHAYLNLAFGYLRQRFPEDSLGQEKALQLAYTNYKNALDIQTETGDMDGARKSLEGLAATVLTLKKSVKTLEWLKLELGLMDYQAPQLKVGEIKDKLEAMKTAHDDLVKETEMTFNSRKNSVQGKHKTEKNTSYAKTFNKKHDPKVSVKKAESSSAVTEDESKSAGKNNVEYTSAGMEPESHSSGKKSDSPNKDIDKKSRKNVKDRKRAREELPA